MTQVELGDRIGLSAPAVSNIINGNAKPRPITLTKLIQVLCHTREEYQNLIACYEGGADKLKEIPEFLEWKPNEEEELERARRYLQVKAESIRFENAVAEALKLGGFQFRRNVLEDDLVADFIVDTPSGAIAIECKYNVNRDWDRTFSTVKLLLKKLSCKKVIIVIPSDNELIPQIRSAVANLDGRILSLENFYTSFKKEF